MIEDLFYRFVVLVGRRVFWLASRPVVLHAERGGAPGGFLLAANHLSPYDVACLMNTTRRRIDFVSIVELFRKPLVGWFFRSLNAMPLDRRRVDGVTLRSVIERLRAGRVVGIFPEGGLRTEATSVLNGGKSRVGIGRMAQVAEVPIVPCVIVDSSNFAGRGAWLPLRRTRYAVAYGEPIERRADLDDGPARAALEADWKTSMLALRAELEPHLVWRRRSGGPG